MNGQPVSGKEGALGSSLWYTGLLERPLLRPRRTWNCGALTGTATEGSSWWGPWGWVQTTVQAVWLCIRQYRSGKMGILLVMPECLTLALSTTPFVTRDLLEQNFGWNNTGDKHGVCMQWSADVWNYLHWSAHLPLASLHTDRQLDGCCSDVSVVAVWVPSFCGGLGLWRRTLSWKYTQLYLGFFFFIFFFFWRTDYLLFWHFNIWWILYLYTWYSF